MQCPGCGHDVSPHQKFCDECGHALTPTSAVADALPTQPLAIQDDSDAEPGATDSEAPATSIDADLPTQPIDAQPIEAQPPHDDSAAAPRIGSADEVGAVGETRPSTIDADLPTQPIDAQPAELPPPTGDVTTPIVVPDEHGSWVDATPTTPLVTSTIGDDVYDPMGTSTEEFPALVFDGQEDLVDYPAPRDPFRLRIGFLLAIFAAIAMVMTTVADMIDIRTTRPASGIETGVRTLTDLGSNLGMAGFIGVAVMVVGALLSCFGLRWGAGLAGGAGLAVLGWAGLVIGLAELPIAIAESITRTSNESFTLRVTRDLGWWLALSVGVLGLLVFLASLRLAGTGRRPALNPIVAALTAMASVVLAAGPLVPVGSASFADNFRSTDPERDLPTAFFAGRLGQVLLIALAGVIGMLIVRSFGLGLAAGGVGVATWMWATSLGQLGEDPVGIAVQNPGATSTEPHAVTTVGMVMMLLFLVVAAALAAWRLNRHQASG